MYRSAHVGQALCKLRAVWQNIENVTQATGVVVRDQAVDADVACRDVADEADEAGDRARSPHGDLRRSEIFSSVDSEVAVNFYEGGESDEMLRARRHG